MKKFTLAILVLFMASSLSYAGLFGCRKKYRSYGCYSSCKPYKVYKVKYRPHKVHYRRGCASLVTVGRRTFLWSLR